jgi:hypothetical protein
MKDDTRNDHLDRFDTLVPYGEGLSRDFLYGFAWRVIETTDQPDQVDRNGIK